jgi:hypothetical protein
VRPRPASARCRRSSPSTASPARRSSSAGTRSSVELSPDEERRRHEADETRESLESGIAQWEVRVELPSSHEAEALAEHLEGEGYSVVRRSAYLLVGANDEDDATALSQRLESQGNVHVEPGSGTAWQLMPGNPFAVFGGLGA